MQLSRCTSRFVLGKQKERELKLAESEWSCSGVYTLQLEEMKREEATGFVFGNNEESLMQTRGSVSPNFSFGTLTPPKQIPRFDLSAAKSKVWV